MKIFPLCAALFCGAVLSTAANDPVAVPHFSPQIGPGGAVTFQLKAADAKTAVVRGQWTKELLNLTRGEDGIWKAEASVPAGVWEYSFIVDGVQMIDPANPSFKPMREPRSSILHLPSDPPSPWDFQDVPHGSVHHHGYLSKVLGRPREVAVYTPPGYETGGDSYPLLVLQHGSGDNQATWVAHGKAHWILDSLIDKKLAVPMIIMMIDGHPLGMVPREDEAKRLQANGLFDRELLEDAMPLVESLYRVRSGAEHRAIAGLSMGGGHSLGTGLGHPDRFSAIGAFSAAPPKNYTALAGWADAESTNRSLHLLWIACGKEDFLLERNESFVAALTERGIKHEWRLTDGDHSWPVWRQYLNDFVPLLFKE